MDAAILGALGITVFMLFQTLMIIFNRVLYGVVRFNQDVTTNRKNVTTTVNINILKNTVENYIIFGLNLLFTGYFNVLPAENVLLLALTFLIGRGVLYFGYHIGAQSEKPHYRAPGFLLTTGLNLALMYYNAKFLFPQIKF